MKKIVLMFVLASLFFACEGESEASIGEFTTVEFNEIYDAGTVAKGEIVQAKIPVKNTGDYPLILASVNASCACTVTDYPKDPIAPGETTYINAEVDTDRTSTGMIEKPITISANTRPSSFKVVIQANVID
ncbi:MAG: DUF1573 domain-containing protein [Brumimicrobium sp.]|nr:DUF1573 domain-containing protein [Brumimicrobium sp.]